MTKPLDRQVRLQTGAWVATLAAAPALVTSDNVHCDGAATEGEA